jgi:ATP-binding cassette, subfamily G (WHITE), member 2, SNQ2
MVIALITGLTFLQLGDSASDLQYRVFVIFIATVVPALILAQVEPTYILARNIFIREDSSKMYSPWIFSLGQLLAEMPNSLLCAVTFFLLLTYPAGFQTASSRAGYQFLIILITEIFSVTLGQAIAALSPSIFIAALFNPFMLVIMSIFCGVTIPKPNMVKFWRVWMYPLDPFTRLVSGMVSTELQGRVVNCKVSELQTFNPPSGQTCGDYAREFLKIATGHIVNENATSDCGYCQYTTGQNFFEPLGIFFDDRWRDLVSASRFRFSDESLISISGNLHCLRRLQHSCHPCCEPLPQVC